MPPVAAAEGGAEAALLLDPVAPAFGPDGVDPDVAGGDRIRAFDRLEALAERLAGSGREEGLAGVGVGEALRRGFERSLEAGGARAGQQEEAEDQDCGVSSGGDGGGGGGRNW